MNGVLPDCLVWESPVSTGECTQRALNALRHLFIYPALEQSGTPSHALNNEHSRYHRQQRAQARVDHGPRHDKQHSRPENANGSNCKSGLNHRRSYCIHRISRNEVRDMGKRSALKPQ